MLHLFLNFFGESKIIELFVADNYIASDESDVTDENLNIPNPPDLKTTMDFLNSTHSNNNTPVSNKKVKILSNVPVNINLLEGFYLIILFHSIFSSNNIIKHI